MAFLPTTKKAIEQLGWDVPDFVLVTGDAYVDHPTFGVAIISRLLESYGYKIAILAQPDWRTDRDFTRFGQPKLGFMVTAAISILWLPTIPLPEENATTTLIPPEERQENVQTVPLRCIPKR